MAIEKTSEKKKEIEDNNKTLLSDFKRNGSLMRRKLLEYLPAMMITNLSNLLLISVDGLVVGNFLGKDAFASVNVFGPVTTFIGAVTCLAAMGIATNLSTAIGSNRQDEINRVRGASFQFMIIMAVFVSIVQIPIVYLIINSYHLSPEINSLVWQYAIGIMICSPLGLISTVGVYQLQIVGRMNILMRLAVMEGVTNLILDLLFVGAFHMGVAGAGYGTACSNFLRASATVFYLARYTDIYKRDGYRTRLRDFWDIIRTGAPDCAYSAMLTFQSYFVIKILLDVFGSDGGVLNGVTAFCFGLTNVLISGIQGAMRPLVGLLSGADDRKGLSTLMKSGFRLNLLSAGLCTIIVWLFPQIFYSMNGITDIPDGGIASLRIFSLYFVFKGFNMLIRLYLTNRKDSSFATRLTLIGYALMPLIAFILSRIAPAPWVWFAYLINDAMMFAVLYSRFLWWKNKDKEEDYRTGEDLVLYMTVTPDEAISASRAIRKYADEHGINPRISNRVALCMEEMVSYADKVKENENNIEEIKAQMWSAARAQAEKAFDVEINEFGVQVMVRFRGSDAATVTVLDDGRKIKLDMDEEERRLTTDNYELLRRLAKEREYQYILDMNYTTLKFEA